MTTTQPGSAHRIVAGLDDSPASLAALEWAAHQAELTGAVLEVIMTWEWPTSYGWTLPISSDYNPAHDAEKSVSELLEPVRQAHPGLAIDGTVFEGHPAPVLVKASKGADLLVVGSRGHGEFSGMLLGSVSEHCVSNAFCPVLVFRDQG
jgi:nucleotide-binding universal stress UspA family protein